MASVSEIIFLHEVHKENHNEQKSLFWHLKRSGCVISASSAPASILRLKASSKSIQSLFDEKKMEMKKGPTVKDLSFIPAISHGVRNENKALELYRKVTEKTVLTDWPFLAEDQIPHKTRVPREDRKFFIGGSLDGVSYTPGKLEEPPCILEVKCPYSKYKVINALNPDPKSFKIQEDHLIQIWCLQSIFGIESAEYVVYITAERKRAHKLSNDGYPMDSIPFEIRNKSSTFEHLCDTLVIVPVQLPPNFGERIRNTLVDFARNLIEEKTLNENKFIKSKKRVDLSSLVGDYMQYIGKPQRIHWNP